MRALTRRCRLASGLVAVAVASVVLPGSAGAHDVGQGELAEARERIKQVEDALSGARGRSSAAQAALREADQRLAEVEAAVNAAAVAVERQQVAVDTAAERLERLIAEAEAVRAAFRARAVDLFKRGTALPYEVVLGSDDISEALERSEFLRVVTLSDTAQLEALEAARVAVDAGRERLDAELAHLEQMKAEEEALLAEVAAIREQRAQVARAAHQEVHALEEQHGDLEAEARRLTRLIQARQRAAAAATQSRSTGSPSTSGYIWPRCDKVTSEYGRRWGRLHAGIDIDGSTGAPIVAAKAGVVIFAAWQGGYGRLALVDHGDGVVTAYAHMSAFSVSDGQSVSRGQRVGSVGSTGNSTGSHLHFETRVNGNPVNPRRFLPGSC